MDKEIDKEEIEKIKEYFKNWEPMLFEEKPELINHKWKYKRDWALKKKTDILLNYIHHLETKVKELEETLNIGTQKIKMLIKTELSVLRNLLEKDGFIGYADNVQDILENLEEGEKEYMKIIDILVAKANGTLEDGFEFKFDSMIFHYYKEVDSIKSKNNGFLGSLHTIDNYLNDEVEVIEQNKKIEELPELPSEGIYSPVINENRNKINELTRSVNKLIKEREEK